MDESTELGIVEMGANHSGEIELLCNIAEPDFGIITNIGEAHLEGFGSYENIIATKQALYRHVIQKNGKLFVNASDSLLMQLSESAERYTYGQTGTRLSRNQANCPLFGLFNPGSQRTVVHQDSLGGWL